MGSVDRISGIAHAKKAFTLVEEFKNFAFKGNVIDMSVGVVIGTAFGNITNSFVKNIIMPLLGMVLPGNKGYLGWKIVVGAKEIPYGLFMGEVVNFLIIAAVLFFFIVKFLGFLTRTRKLADAVPLALTKDQVLLSEIRDLLRERNAAAKSKP